MYNKVTLMGRICHDLELKTTASGIFVLSFRIAVERSYQPKKEERITDFFNIVAWRGTAEFISKYFYKGCLILIDGELQTRQYTDKDNFKRTMVEVVADKVSFTGEVKSQDISQTTSQISNTEKQQEAQTLYSDNSQDYIQDEIEYTDDDYPF